MFLVWPRIIAIVHDTTDLIDRMGFRVESDVAAGDTFSYVVDLTGTDDCCLCPEAKYWSGLNGEVLLTNTVNRFADVRSDWKNKKPFINEPMPTEPCWRWYVEIPKRTVEVSFENRGTVTTTARFFAEFDKMDFLKGKKLVEWAFEKIAKRWIDITMPE